ncbi:MAG TPA: hypothetical protein VGL58_14420 [Caulobacteraceae bacterium]
MTTETELRREILGLEDQLLIYARRLTQEDGEAEQLVQRTLQAALEEGVSPPEGGAMLVWLYGLTRKVFHSVERRRSTSRERGTANRQWRADRAEAFIAAGRQRLPS